MTARATGRSRTRSPADGIVARGSSCRRVTMRLDTRAFAFAAGVTTAVLFVICALAIAIAPGPTTAFAGYLILMDLSGIQRKLTIGSFVVGLIVWTVGVGLTFGLTA